MKRLLLLPVLLSLRLVPLVAAPPTGAPDFPSGPGVDLLQVVCDQVPIEQGLTFDRTKVKAGTVNVQGQSTDAWTAVGSITPGMNWMQSFRFTVTDPRFQKGGRPVVEIEAICYLPKAGAISIRVDTATGARKVAEQYYQGKDWMTLRVRVDDAFFGARPDTGTDKLSLSGFDLRIDGSTGPFYVRSVRIAGYSTDSNVIWPKMLKSEGLTTGGPGGVLVWQKAPAQNLGISLRNFAHIPVDLQYRVQVTGYDEKVRFTQEGKVTAAPSAATPLSWTIDTSDWRLGPYDGDFEAFAPANPSVILVRERFHLGLISSAVLEKARDGEFLYGLDPANCFVFNTHTPVAFAYYRLMGVDILRGLYDKYLPETTQDVGKALGDLTAENVQGEMMTIPPWSTDPVRLAAAMKQKDAFFEEVGRLYGGKGVGRIHYYELGNEPDLAGFYPGPPASYVRTYEEIRDSIKRGTTKAGLPDSATVVVTGGLSFAGAEGPPRAEEMIKDFDPSKVDAIAYHGHGAGIMAERHAYENVHAVAAKYGKQNHLFFETESGVSGQGHVGMEEQALTVVQKMVYVQTQHEPLFMFFRLFMEGSAYGMEGGYSMTDHFIQPHPSVLAYRNLVERLRHRTYVKTLDILGKTGVENVDAFVFAEKDAKGSATGRKTVVLFAETPTHADVRLKLDSGAAVTDSHLYDMYGNSSAVTVPASDVTSVPVTKYPVFLSWTSPGDSNLIDVVQPLLSVAIQQPLQANADNTVGVTVRNAQAQPMDATVALTAQSRLQIQVSPPSAKITVPGNSSATASFDLKIGNAVQPLRLPLWWKAFVNVGIDQANLPQLTTIPDTLPGTSGVVSGQDVWTPNNHIDFSKLAGGLSEKRPAVAMTYFDSEQDTVLPCATSADWYMAWYVNGVKVFDTLTAGNLGGSLADHTFDLPLKKGRNLIVVEVLSGSQGWAFDFGGPKERQIAVTSGNDPDQISVTTTSDGQTSNPLVVPIQLQNVVPAIDPAAALDQLNTWNSLEPLAVPDDSAVKNLWMKEPDSSKWYGGKSDLSGIFWLRDAGKNLELFMAITDDKLVEAASPDKLSQGDAVHVVLADDNGKTLLDATGGLIADKPTLAAPIAGVTFTASRQANPGTPAQTLYRLEIPNSIIGAKPFRLSLSVLDNDSTFLKQTLDLGDVANPAAGIRLKTRD